VDILRRKTTRVSLVILAMAAVIVVGLLVVYHQSPAAEPGGLPTGPHSTSSSTDGSRPGSGAKGSASPATHGSPLPGPFASFPVPLQNPKGFSIRLLPAHTVVLQVTAPGTVARVGYLVPSSLDSPYGDRKNVSAPWSKTMHAGGSGYLAAIFLQTDATGTPVTCRITIDGTLRETKTFTGSFARGICAA
jgi:Mycobacterium membrane protein